MKQRTKRIILKALKNIWYVKLFNWINKDRTLCKSCHKQKGEADYKGLCFDCYYKTLIFERGLKER